MYIFLSTLFVIMVGFIVALLVFTPLKYYLPGVGYGNARQMKEYKMLKIRTDSMEQALRYKQRYYDDLHKVLKGQMPVLDTNKLSLPKVEKSVE